MERQRLCAAARVPATERRRGMAEMTEDRRDFEFTDHEYLTRCTDGCGAITGWIVSLDAANDAGRVHETDRGHHWEVTNRMKQ
jgi:hypothetical protein